jgi:type IV secretion system protein VirB9
MLQWLQTAALVSASLVLLALSPMQARAELAPQPSPGDPRLQVVRYDPNEVVRLTATLGYAVTLSFGDGERVENVSIGDSLGWQVTPNRRANLLFIKPVESGRATNMTVVTNLRRYNFDLRVRHPHRAGDTRVVLGLRFDYPEPVRLADLTPPPAPEPPPPPEPPNQLHKAYSFEGNFRGLPTKVFDDGTSTYFVFPDTAEVPAIYALDADKKEAMVNVAIRDGYMVVDRVARGFTLRRGNETCRIFNDQYEEAAPHTELTPHRDRKVKHP